jgi:glycerate dehydrogenase
MVLNPGDLSWEPLNDFGRLTVYDRTPASELVSRLKEATVVFSDLNEITEEIMAECPKLKYIGLLATGFEKIDLKAAKARGIAVTNVPNHSTALISQHALALLLEICHQVGRYSQAVHQGNWVKAREWSYTQYPLLDLDGLTMGVIGLGYIGLALARKAAALGMKIVADKNHLAKVEAGINIEYLRLEEILAQSDVISLCCSLNSSTRQMINQETIRLMKNGVIIINIARGQLINEDHLAQALKSWKVMAAGLDVVSLEPIREDNPLLGLKNCFITPHMAASSTICRQRLLTIALDNFKMFLAGTPVNIVNK